MKRRKFIAASAMSLSALTIPLNAGLPDKRVDYRNNKIKPPKLIPGNTVGLIAPGSFISENELSESIENVEKMGLKTYFTDNIMEKYGYLAGTDKMRVDDLNHMFTNPEISGIICIRGGYGCNRILPKIDYELIKKNPKVLVGYSDITALHYALFANTGLISFHGPVGISTFNDYSINYMKNVIMESNNELKLISAEEDQSRDDEAYKLHIINEGIAEGELIGGNLSIAASLLGTPYDVDYKGKIVYLEDIGEEPYRIDRMLTELLLAEKLQTAAGIALGVFIDCEVDDKKPSFNDSFTLKEVLKDRLSELNIPVIYGLSFGHIKNKFTLPFGVKAKLDTFKKQITLLESPVL